MSVLRGNESADVGLCSGNVAGMEEHVANDNFLLFVGRRITSAGAIDQHDWVNSAEKIVGLKFKMEADARIAVAAALAPFEAHSHVVVGALLVVDNSAREIIVAHHIGVGVQQSGIGGRKNDSNVMRERKIGLPIADGVKSGRIGAVRGISRGCAQAVNRADIELNYRARTVAWNCSQIDYLRRATSIRARCHGGGVPNAAVDGPPDLSRSDSLRVARHDRNRHVLS